MGQPQQLSDFSLILLINSRDLIHLVTIEAPVEGELGKVYSTAPEVAIGSGGKTYYIKGRNSPTAFAKSPDAASPNSRACSRRPPL